MTHRFYTGESKGRGGVIELTTHLWVNDGELTNQVLRVLRMRVGEELILFNGQGKEVLYKLDEIEPSAFHVTKVTDIQPRHPKRKITLAWALLKKDKNEWVLQKCTELGVSHFVPIISARTEKLGFDEERAHKILIEASEQCGRHDIPSVQEPLPLRDFVAQHADHSKIFVADMGGESAPIELDHATVLVGPEGGWSDEERQFFAEYDLPTLTLGDFVLRAETASIAAIQKLV